MTHIDWRETALVRTAGARRQLKRQAMILGGIVVFLWLVELVDWLILDGALDSHGIRPRTLDGLQALVVSPWLHAGFGHLLANTVPFVVLGWLVMVRRTADFFVAGAVALFASGLGIWLFGGANSIHIGISGVVFGFLGFLLARGFYHRNVGSIGLAVVALLLYGGMLWGVLPLRSDVSWQGHLFGFLGGWFAAYLLQRISPNGTRDLSPPQGQMRGGPQ